jgi:HSP20 family protein
MPLLYVFTRSAWKPAVDICRTDDAVLLVAEVPGCRPDRLSVTVERHRVILAGVREPPVPAARWLQGEIAWGAFERVIALPVPVDPHAARAECRDGLLLVRCPLGTMVSSPVRVIVNAFE